MNDFTLNKNKNYTINLPLYGFDRERIEKELSKVDNSPFKEAQKKNFDLSRRPKSFELWLWENTE